MNTRTRCSSSFHPSLPPQSVPPDPDAPIAPGGQRSPSSPSPRSKASRRPTPIVATFAVAIALLIAIGDNAAARPKPLASGLLTVGNTGEWPTLVDAWDPEIEWRTLQPGPFRFDLAPIVTAIQHARASGDVLRLRILAGRYAPRWVKRRFGTVAMYDPVDDVTAKVPRWWVPGYMRVYARFQRRLAARFDDVATIRAVTVAGATTIYCEPFIRGTSAGITRRNLLAAGYTRRKDRRAILASIAAQRSWHRTRQILALNPWQFVRSDGTYGSTSRFTVRAMHRFRSLFGRRAILQNNSIRSSWITQGMPPGYGAMYRHMKRLGPPISFQTARSSRVGNLDTVLQWSLRFHAHAVELHRGSTTQLTTSQAVSFDADLEANG
jgi:hypothetical protein